MEGVYFSRVVVFALGCEPGIGMRERAFGLLRLLQRVDCKAVCNLPDIRPPLSRR